MGITYGSRRPCLGEEGFQRRYIKWVSDGVVYEHLPFGGLAFHHAWVGGYRIWLSSPFVGGFKVGMWVVYMTSPSQRGFS